MVLITGLFLQFLSFGNILNQLAQADVFAYVLPFLLIFALVYGILSKTETFGKDNRGVNVIIAVALGLLSLVGNYFPNFIQVMSPKLAIALCLLLAVIVLLSLFVTEETKWIRNIFIGVGIASFAVIAYSSLYDYSFYGSFMWQDYGPAVVTLIIIAVIIALIVKKPK